MKKQGLLIKEEINRILEISGVNPIANKQLIVVDIQPEYADGFSHFLREFVTFINTNYESLNRLVFLFNGQDTLGMISESEYKNWWYELGLEEEIIESAIFYDKGYAFFRYCIDSNISDESISNLVREMMRLDINDSRQLTEEFWDQFIVDYGDEEIRSLLEIADDCISIPELMDFLTRFNSIVICGGGVNECLKEVEIALNSLDKPYNVLTKFIY